MNNEIEASYPVLGQLLIDILDDDFREAFLNIELSDDVWGAELFYRNHDGVIRYINEGLAQIEQEFRKMRNRFSSTGHTPFSMATFHLFDSGKFEIDYGYEDVTDFDMAGQRRENWITKYLGKNAVINWS
jgi:hypothetical protein